jgi:hypothetical protein
MVFYDNASRHKTVWYILFYTMRMSHEYTIGWSIVRVPPIMLLLRRDGDIVKLNGLGGEKAKPGQDTAAERQKVAGNNDVTDEDGKAKGEEEAEGGDDIPPDRGTSFNGKRLTNGCKRRFTYFLVVKDSQPFC